MKRRGHVLFTLVLTAGAAYAVDTYWLALPDAVIALGIAEAVLASALPDIIEPGRSSDHRRGAHSWRLLVACLVAAGAGLWMMPQDVWRWHALLFLPWGYATHLMADALTPAGLPF